jgi:4'-phosphopantetheinyl transferase
MKSGGSAAVAAPPAGVVDVWAVDLVAPDAEHVALTASLDHEERRHAERMRVGGREWAAARGARRTILAGYLGAAPGVLRFVHTSAGKPRLAEGERGLRFSCARTDGLALLAVASDRELGVDVERENERTDIAAVAREFLPALEVAAIEMTDATARRGAFFSAWARHEARLKLAGRGLDERARAGVPEPGPLVLVRTVTPRAGFAAAVAAEGSGWSVRLREFRHGAAGHAPARGEIGHSER